MAEKVIVKGGQDDGAQFENAATEATLLRLVELFEAKTKKSGGSDAAHRARELAVKMQQAQTNAQQQNTGQVNQSTSALQKLSGAVVDAAAALGNLIGFILGKTLSALVSLTKFITNTTIGAIKLLTKGLWEVGKFGARLLYDALKWTADFIFGTVKLALSTFSDLLFSSKLRLSEFTDGIKNIPILSLFHSLAVFLDNNIDTWRKLSTVGAAFGNDIFQMRLAAAQAEQPLKIFADFVEKNAGLLKFLGDSVTTGVQQFAQLNRAMIDSGYTDQLMNMGMTMENINDVMAAYININQRSGRLQKQSVGEFTTGVRDLAVEMDLLAKATGLSRKAMLDETAKISADPIWQTQLATLTEEQQKVVTNLMSAISAADPSNEIANGIKTSLGGVFQSSTAQAMQIFGPELSNVISRMTSGGFNSLEDANNAFVIAAKSTLDKLRKEFPNAAQNIAFLQGNNAVAKSSVQLMGQLSTMLMNMKEITPEMKREQDARANVTDMLSSFEQTVSSIRGRVESSLLSSKVFEKLKGLLDTTKQSFGTMAEHITNFILPHIRGMADWFGKLITDLQKAKSADDIKHTISTYIKDAFSNITGYISSIIHTLFDLKTTDNAGEVFLNWIKTQFDNLSKLLFNVQEGETVSGVIFEWLYKQLSDFASFGWNKIWDSFDGLGGKIFELIKSGFSGISTLFSNINGESVAKFAVGVVAVSASVFLLKSAISALISPQILGGIAILIGSIAGIGIALQQLIPFMEASSKAMSGLVSTFTNGISDIIAKFTELSTAGTDAVTRQLEMLAKLPKGSLSDTADEIIKLKVALDMFKPSLLDGLMSSFNSLFSADLASQLAELGEQCNKINCLVEALKNLDFSSLTNAELKTKVTELATALDSINCDKFGELANKINYVTTALKNLNFDKLDTAVVEEKILKLANSLQTLDFSKLATAGSNVEILVNSLKQLDGIKVDGIKLDFGDSSLKLNELATSLQKLDFSKFVDGRTKVLALSSALQKIDYSNIYEVEHRTQLLVEALQKIDFSKFTDADTNINKLSTALQSLQFDKLDTISLETKLNSLAETIQKVNFNKLNTGNLENNIKSLATTLQALDLTKLDTSGLSDKLNSLSESLSLIDFSKLNTSDLESKLTTISNLIKSVDFSNLNTDNLQNKVTEIVNSLNELDFSKFRTAATNIDVLSIALQNVNFANINTGLIEFNKVETSINKFKEILQSIGDLKINFNFLTDAINALKSLDFTKLDTSLLNFDNIKFNPTVFNQLTAGLSLVSESLIMLVNNLQQVNFSKFWEASDKVKFLSDLLTQINFNTLNTDNLNFNSIDTGSDKLKVLSDHLSIATSKVYDLADALNEVNFNKLDVKTVNFDKIEIGAKKIEILSSQLNNLKKSITEVSAPDVATTLKDAIKKISESIELAIPDNQGTSSETQAINSLSMKLDQLNLNVAALVKIQQEALPEIKTTAKNSKKGAGNLN